MNTYNHNVNTQATLRIINVPKSMLKKAQRSQLSICAKCWMLNVQNVDCIVVVMYRLVTANNIRAVPCFKNNMGDSNKFEFQIKKTFSISSRHCLYTISFVYTAHLGCGESLTSKQVLEQYLAAVISHHHLQLLLAFSSACRVFLWHAHRSPPRKQ